MKQVLFNPFLKVAGIKALILGWIIMALTAVIAIFSHCHFNGAIDAHVGKPAVWWFYFAEAFIDWAALVLPLYGMGLLFSKSRIRFLDIAGTLALARFPMFFIALLAFGPIPDPSMLTISLPIILTIIGVLVCIIWMIALFFNAYTVSCNIKGSKAVLTFIAGLIIAEILSSIIIYQLNQHFHFYF